MSIAAVGRGYESFDGAQLRARRLSARTELGVAVEADAVDDQRIAFPPTDGVAHIARRHGLRMLRAHVDAADHSRHLVEDGDLLGGFEDQDGLARHGHRRDRARAAGRPGGLHDVAALHRGRVALEERLAVGVELRASASGTKMPKVFASHMPVSRG